MISDGTATGISNYLGTLLRSPDPPLESSLSPRAAGPYSVANPTKILVGSLLEGFEGGTFPPTGWTLTSSGASPPFTWHRTTDPLFVGAGVASALVEGEHGSAIDERLISPMFRVSISDSSLRFRWLGNPTFAPNVMGSCEVRRKGESSWATVWSLDQENVGLVFSYLERTLGLSTWLNDSVQVSFHAIGTNGADFGIDEIATGVFPRTGPPSNDLCSAATALPAGAFAISGNTCYAANDRDPYTPPDGNACVSEDASGGDVFYSLNALVDDTLRVHVPGSAAAFTHLYLLASCDGAATCVAGKEPSGGEVDSSLAYIFPSSGTYYLVVDTMGGFCGDFTLSGTWRGPVTAVDGPGQRPTGLTFAIAPNPARGRAARFLGQADARIRGEGILRVFDAAGRAVYTVRFSVGGERFEVFWPGLSTSGKRIAAGRYLARMEVGGKTASASFVLTD